MRKDIRKSEALCVRMSPALRQKLDRLSAEVQRQPCEVVRAIIAAATLESLPKAWRDVQESVLLAEVEG